MPPIIIACPIDGVNGSAVILTKPAIAPLSVAPILVLPSTILLKAIGAITPPAAAHRSISKY